MDVPGHSLFTSMAPILGSAFSIAFARENGFTTGDSLVFSLSQKLRAEQANLTLASGASAASLVPSGRELALELGYRARLGNWAATIAATHRFDAFHVAGGHETSGLITIARLF